MLVCEMLPVYSTKVNILTCSCDYCTVLCCVNGGISLSCLWCVVISTTPFRELMGVSLEVLECVLAASQSGAAMTTAAMIDTCRKASTTTIYDSTFAPACSALGATQCRANAACMLESHDGHFDCVRQSAWVSKVLGGNAYAERVQNMFSACRAMPMADCGTQRMVVTKGALASLETMVEGEEHEDHHDHEESGSSTAGATDEHGHSVAASSTRSKDSQPLRIGAVFIILVSGLIGCAVPFLLKVSSKLCKSWDGTAWPGVPDIRAWHCCVNSVTHC